MNVLQRQDPELWAAIAGEMDRQRNGLEMIASENYTSTGRDAGRGQRADEQVRRRLSRPSDIMAVVSSSI